MITITKQQKIAACKAAIRFYKDRLKSYESIPKHLQNFRIGAGMCYLLNSHLNLKAYYTNYGELKKYFPEFYQMKPKKIPNSALWFAIDDFNSRINLLKNLIKQLQS